MSNFIKRVFTPGTVECAIACALLGVAVALLLMIIGVWPTLLICVLAAAGGFLGGVKNKKAFIRRLFGGRTDSDAN